MKASIIQVWNSFSWDIHSLGSNLKRRFNLLITPYLKRK